MAAARHCQISPVGSCEGATTGPRGAATDGSWERAAPCQIFGATFRQLHFLRRAASKFDFKNQICSCEQMFYFKNLKFFVKFSARIPRSITGVFVCVPANRNLIKRENSIIIYIESERENKSFRFK